MWQYNQLISKYNADKKKTFGFQKKSAPFDAIIAAGEIKLLSKMYKYLLFFKMADEFIKKPVTIWAHHIGYQIPLSDWQSLWNVKHLKSISYKENFTECFIDSIFLNLN